LYNPATPPEESGRWDRFWFWVVNVLSKLQVVVLRDVIREPIWRSSNGQVHRLRDMKSDHLLNTEAMLARNKNTDLLVYKQIGHELWRRGLNKLPPKEKKRGKSRASETAVD
jgi:hypothetical protein